MENLNEIVKKEKPENHVSINGNGSAEDKKKNEEKEKENGKQIPIRD